MTRTRSLATAREAARIADDHKVKDLIILDLKKLSVSDYFVVGTILNRHHGRAVAEGIEKAVKAKGSRPLGIEGLEEGTWVLVDLGDVVVHLFDAEYRKFYDLEVLWSDAKRVSLGAAPKTAKRARTAR